MVVNKHKPKTNPRSQTHHRKRHGLHHRVTSQYVRSYWPYLPMLLIVGIGLFLSSHWGPVSKYDVLGYATRMSQNELLSATNVQRIKHNHPSLTLNTKLMSAAQAKANDMASKNYWSHNTPEGKTPWVFLHASEYNYEKAGENLAYGFATSDTAVVGWMNSPSHRANILEKDYQEVGFGIAHAENYQESGPQTIVVAMYGRPYDSMIEVAAAQPTPAIDTSISNTSAPAVAAANTELIPQKITRLHALTNGVAPWSIGLVFVICAIGLVFLTVKHGLAWRRVIHRGEDFILKHVMLDIIVVTIVVSGYVFSRTIGFIL